MTRSFVPLAISLLLGVNAPAGGHPAVDPDWLDKTRIGLKAACDRYDAIADRIEQEAEVTDKPAPGYGRPLGPYRPGLRKERHVRLGTNHIQEMNRYLDRDPGRPQLLLECDNDRYAFSLRRDDESSPPALADYSPGPRRPPLSQQGQGLGAEYYGHLRTVLAAIERRDKLTLEALRWDAVAAVLTATVSFDAGPAGTVRRQVDVEPDQEWRVVREGGESKFSWGATTYSFGQRAGGVLFPTEMTQTLHYRTENVPQVPPPDRVICCRLTRVALTDKTPADFRLSAFGLPEPPEFAPPGPTVPRLVGWLAAAFVLALLAAALAVLHRRRAARTGG